MKGEGGAAGLEALEKEGKELFAKRATLAKTWEGLWKKGILSSAKLREADATVNQKLEQYRELYHKHEQLKGEWMRGLKQAGKLDQENILAPPSELKSLRTQYQTAKAGFEAERSKMDSLRWEEALSDRLEDQRVQFSKLRALPRSCGEAAPLNPLRKAWSPKLVL